MPAYVVVDSAVHDPEAFKAYAERVGPILKAHGGRPLANNAPDSLEGEWQPAKIVILEFPDVDAAKAWYNSPEYQEIIPLRQGAAVDSLVVLPGL